jgi:hypothetical protein
VVTGPARDVRQNGRTISCSGRPTAVASSPGWIPGERSYAVAARLGSAMRQILAMTEPNCRPSGPEL